MATIHVDGRAYEVVGSHNLLQACLSLGLDVPYFCWHPAMGSVGACRQCAVKQYKDEDDTQGMLVMSCMAPVEEAMRVSIDDEEAYEFRRSVIEWLMANHPHDCPVCEEGGHCHLQDMTVMTGHARRRYRFRKRTHRNQDLGPFIAHEMNRCITCYRCVRFYRDYAGGEDLGAFGSNDNVYFGRYREGALESAFSGNLTEVCPTGVFTDRTHSDHYVRKWDLQFAPSICHQCAVGCNTSPGERYGDIRRIENRYHGEVNGYFLCDRGRFGHGYVNRDDRPRRPEWRNVGEASATPLEVDAALDRGADALRRARRIIGIGSPRASLESNHQLRELVGEANFSSGVVAAEQACLSRMARLARESGLPAPSLREVEAHDAILVLGEDPLQSAARLGLALRRAVLARGEVLAEARDIPAWNAEAVMTLAQGARHPLFIAYPAATGLDSLAEHHLALAEENIARLGFAVAHAIDDRAPAVDDLDESTREAARRIAEALLDAQRPLVVSGGSLASPAILDAAGNIARALAGRRRRGGLTLVRREANSTGVELLGGHPLEWALDELSRGAADALVVLENDLYQRLPRAPVDRALEASALVVVLDHQRTPTWQRAHLGLPAASFAEASGTLVSLEGRAQRFFAVHEPRYHRPESRIHSSWRWLHALEATLEHRQASDVGLETVIRACADRHPALAAIIDAAPGNDYRIEGLELARAPHRYSGRTAMRAHLDVSEPRPPSDADTPFVFSMEGYSGSDRPRSLVAFAWAPGWNSPQAWNKFTDEVGGHLRGGDPGVRVLEPGSRERSHERSHGRSHERSSESGYATEVPAAFAARDGEWRVVILPRLFGGEETSSLSAAIAARAGASTLTLAADDARRLGVTEGDSLSLETADTRRNLPLRVDPLLPPGLVAVPAGVDPALASGDSARLALPDSMGVETP
ncbi:NADH-quinone oxidoreductase subunit NuoG [Halomonas sp. TRM85114]|uniref:NADH-quinone oxidoreductase subunit NuoG n=1 Tax=Halomonas jincaotanensis TaxID=2810616 RepID=UPI001BD548F1|nr:NADH-quinone oxidoreductase subunit NuoG [Halomonas jincaotanensis]MBS9404663.1 NADH-quinone oxidoreductase subunit NuoG [Halomonas jincaotanensis]